jgi:acetolactate synthase-1/2/3 large subunit
MTQRRVADVVADRLHAAGLDTVFMLTGGGAMHLNDALAYHPGLRVVCFHHEQACAMAAEGYARIAGKPAIVNVTTGPGGINALNGVFGAFTDSIPMVVVSGQVKRETLVTSYDLPGLRQLGDQEVDIVRMASGITKEAVQIRDPAAAAATIDRAVRLATSGRQGPVWVDIPIDVQGARMDGPDEVAVVAPPGADADAAALASACEEIVARLGRAERPAFLVGSGVRLAGGLAAMRACATRLNVPVATAWTAIDALETDHPLYGGRPSTIGDRGGNFTVQNSDLLIVVGSRLNIRQVSYNWRAFARHAFKVQVDVDPWELRKPTVKPDLPVLADAARFFTALARTAESRGFDGARFEGWIERCRRRVARYPVVQPRQREFREGLLNPYRFVERLYELLGEDDVVVCANATASIVAGQVARIRRGQRLICNSGDASMGFDLPAALGAAIAHGGRRVVCLAGDGSLMMNLQELQTLALTRLPVKLFVLSNEGYLSMRLTQGSFFKRLIGAGPSSGVSFPDVVRLAQAFDLPTARAAGEDFSAVVERALTSDGPFVCDVTLDPKQEFEPKLASRQLPDGRIVSPALEDMSPFLSREELLENLEVPPWDEG